MQTILVVGGAGYIGSHTVKMLNQKGYQTVVLDDLSTGHRKAAALASRNGKFYEGRYDDATILRKILSENQIDGVMHFGAKALVGESFEKPDYYFAENVEGTRSLLTSLTESKVRKIIFSSTCATYGIPEFMPITEKTPQKPVNPYGESKLRAEKLFKNAAKAHGFHVGIVRYFNASGCDPEGELGEDHHPETHLIPNVFKAAMGLTDSLTINGHDYQTPDGTCVRDYIHVCDLADAHLRMLKKLDTSPETLEVNLGSNQGRSILQVISTVEQVTGKKIKTVVGPRRPGDPPILVADSAKAFDVLNWRPIFDLKAIIETAWNWTKSHPRGYS